MNHDQSKPVQWPAILIQEEQAELVYLTSEQEWQLEQQNHLEESSRLLDAVGVTYILSPAYTGLSWLVSNKPLCLSEILDLVREHASILGHCCTAKMGAESIEQIFEIMKFLEEN